MPSASWKLQNTGHDMEHSEKNKSHFLAWDEEYRHVTWGGPRSISMVEEFMSSSSSSRLLDAGCGNGRYSLPLSRKYDVVGIDVSANAISKAQTYIKKSGHDALLLVSTITDLPFSENSFDAVICYGVLQHLLEHERKQTVDEFRRVLKPGALLFFEAFGVEDMRYGGEELEKDTFVRKGGIIYHYFSEKELRSLFSEFETVKLENIRVEKRFKGELYTRHHIRAVLRS
ncbi:class I SAM-dependent methyltransferase [Methanolobus sp. ZRKC3]|uniref:class I SAM-dependent methyltransferase n=1 Tax=Methanolobus sp. ZRKC3 TaxID=3125786 RepID=UPI0032458EB0